MSLRSLSTNMNSFDSLRFHLTVSIRNVTAIFSILMRLRQAVLHPTLVLKRLKENLAAQGKPRKNADVSDLELATANMDDYTIQKMIEKYSAAKDGSFGDEVLEGLLEPKEEGDVVEDDSECMLCLEVSDPLGLTA